MMRALACASLVALSACGTTSDPRLDANVRVTPDGVRVHPSAGMRVSGVGITVSP